MFICTNCKKEYSKWSGKCENCGSWNTLEEGTQKLQMRKGSAKQTKRAVPQIKPVKIFDTISEKEFEEINTGIHEFDNVVGGRLLAGQLVLLAGAPGIGKSTLCLQIIEKLSLDRKKVLYVCGEESVYQIKKRVERLSLNLENVEFINERDIFSIQHFLEQNPYDALLVDSIQTIFSPDISSASGSVSQISECTNVLLNCAKSLNLLTFVIGHITKTGDIAGPMVLEHMVDTVLLFEGDKKNDLRYIRVEKNRFGPTDEVGIFRMEDKGLVEVSDTKDLLEKNFVVDSGSVYSMVSEGSRPIVLEVQALATKTYFTNPRRTTSGFDINRLYIILAIIDKKFKLRTFEYDIVVNIVGGIKISDTGLDLAVFVAVVSSILDTIVSQETIAFGEIGLSGEIKKVYLEEKKKKESLRLGFKNILSKANYKSLFEVYSSIFSKNK